MKNAIFPLFAYPVMIAAQQYPFSDAERKFIAELEMIGNTGNSMSKSDTVLNSEELSKLRTFIDEQLSVYAKQLLRIKDDNEIYITQSWVNKAGADQYHPKHKHQNSVISGVMYLDENRDERLPPIRFHRSHEMFPLEFKFDELNDFNSSCKSFAPDQGMLMLFPSLLEHDVEKNESEEVRTSLSFNTYVRGVVGGKKQLTEVHIA
jgi:uncharacterized protein (TIGR02466 family)